MTLFLLGSQPHHLQHHLPSFISLTEIPDVVPELSCFIINSESPEEQDLWLTQIRKHPHCFFAPVFTLQRSPLADFLSDGDLPSDFALRCEQFQQRYVQLKVDPNLGLTERLLTYLWLWPERKLLAQSNPAHAGLYNYPLATLWSGESTDLFVWLYATERDGLLAGDTLVDRVRYCNACHSGHLNYVESCPECGSIDVASESALHCFACGHVATQDAFLQGGQLSCPNCLSKLRHIGVDYDRPLENYRCQSCHSLFTDGVVKVRCLEHGHEQTPEQLIIRTIRHYTLTDEAVAYLRHGSLRHMIPEWIGGSVSTEHFCWLLLWQNKLAIRHQNSHLVLAFKFTDIPAVVSRLGEAEAMVRLDALTQRLQSLLRLTDVCCHYRDDLLLFFLPNTPTNHHLVIIDKLQLLIREQIHVQVGIDFRLRDLPDDRLDDQAGLWIEQWIVELGV